MGAMKAVFTEMEETGCSERQAQGRVRAERDGMFSVAVDDVGRQVWHYYGTGNPCPYVLREISDDGDRSIVEDQSSIRNGRYDLLSADTLELFAP